MSIKRGENCYVKYKAVFIDADNTLLDSKHNISKKNKEAVAAAYDLGVKIIICSGRSYVNIKDFVRELNIKGDGNYISSFNGGLIMSTDGLNYKTICREQLKKHQALSIISELRKYNVDIILYNDPTYTIIEKETETTKKYYSVTNMNHKIVNNFSELINDEIPKMMALGSHEILEIIIKKLDNIVRDDINVFFSMDTMIEFTSKNATKGKSLIYLCNKLGIDPMETIAIGDNHNDISMLKQAGLSAVVANAAEEVKKYANYITTATNNESAVAEILNRFIVKSI